jgi:hypothetical protein
MDAELGATAVSVLFVLGPADAPHSAGLAETVVALELLTTLAADEAASHALVDGHAVEQLTEQLLDRYCTAVLRAQILVPLTELLHHAHAMARFTTSQKSRSANGAARPAASAEVRTDDLFSCYQRVLDWMLKPLPPLLVAPLQQIMRLVAAWEAIQGLCEASEGALHEEGGCSPHVGDAVCVPVLRALLHVTYAVHALLPSINVHDKQRVELGALVCHSANSHPRARPALTAAPFEATAGFDSSELSFSQAKLLSGAGVWRAILCALSAPAVRTSTMLPSMAVAIADLVEVLLGGLEGALSLAAQPEVVNALIELLEQPLHLAPAAAAPTPQRDSISATVAKVDADGDALLAAAEKDTEALDVIVSEAVARKLEHQVQLADEGTSAASAAELPHSNAPTWAVRIGRQVRSTCEAVGAMERWLSGGLSCLHTLVSLLASEGDAVASLLSSSTGFALLAACLQPARLATEFGSVTTRYASVLLVHVLASPYSAVALRYHGPWVGTLVKALQAASSRDEALTATLTAAERLLQPLLSMNANGPIALARSVASLLHSGDSHGLVTFETEADPCDEDQMNFTVKAMAAGGAKLREQMRENLAAHVDTLGACVRVLRTQAVHPQVALSLHEAECLDWLRAFLDTGWSLLHEGLDEYATLKTPAQLEADLLWALEAAVGLAHGILWQLAASGLPEHHDSSFLVVLVRLSMDLQRQPTLMNGTSCPPEGNLAKAARALDVGLLHVLSLFWEGKWPSRVHYLLTKVADPNIHASVGVATLLARSLPPPIPMAPESLADAALALRPPAAMPLRHSSLSVALAELARLTTGCGATANAPAAPEDATALEASSARDPLAAVPVVAAGLEEALLQALQARRDRWRVVLTEASADVQKLVMRLAGCSCRVAVEGLAACLTRLADVLPCVLAKEMFVQPLLTLQASLGRCMADDTCKLPPSARGEPSLALGRVALLLASLASQPSGRTVLLAMEPALLGAALTAALVPRDPAVRRAGLAFLGVLGDPALSLASHLVDLKNSGAPDDLPPLSVLGPAAVAAASIADEASSGCAAQARRVLQRLATSLLACVQPSLRELGHALSAADPIAALHAMEGDFALSPAEAERELKLEEAGAAGRVAVWPSAWRPHDSDATDDIRALLSYGPLFNSGLVLTELEYARPVEDDDGEIGHNKRPLELDGRGDAPPPVRGGRGRVREDNPAPRGKANTSRPASKHVDEYSQPGAKRFQNSSRAPSKHVDDYQSAPVVRKTASVDVKGGPDAGGFPEGVAHGMDAPGGEIGRPPHMQPGSRGSEGASGGAGGGSGGSIGINLHMLQQKLGMAAAQSLPSGMMGMQMPQQPRPSLVGPMGMVGRGAPPMGMGMHGMMVVPMPGMMGMMGTPAVGLAAAGMAGMAGIWRAPGIGGMQGTSNVSQGTPGFSAGSGGGTA